MITDNYDNAFLLAPNLEQLIERKPFVPILNQSSAGRLSCKLINGELGNIIRELILGNANIMIINQDAVLNKRLSNERLSLQDTSLVQPRCEFLLNITYDLFMMNTNHCPLPYEILTRFRIELWYNFKNKHCLVISTLFF